MVACDTFLLLLSLDYPLDCSVSRAEYFSPPLVSIDLLLDGTILVLFQALSNCSLTNHHLVIPATARLGDARVLPPPPIVLTFLGFSERAGFRPIVRIRLARRESPALLYAIFFSSRSSRWITPQAAVTCDFWKGSVSSIFRAFRS